MLRAVFLCFALVLPLLASEPLRIGVVAPLTGNQAPSGQALRNAVVMANQETPDFKAELFFEDTGSSMSGVNLATRRLLELSKVDVIFSPYTQEANIVAPLADKAGVIHFSNCWNSDVIENSRLSFSSSVSYKSFGDALVEMIKKKGYERVGLVWEPVWIEGAQWVKKRCAEEGIALEEVKTSAGEKDFRTLIMKLKDKKPDVYVPYLFYPSVDIFIKQLRELGVGEPVTGYLDIVSDISLIEGAEYICEYPNIPEYFARYRARFGATAEQTLAPNAYDNYRMLAYVAKELPQWDSKTAAEMLRGIKDFQGLGGKLSCSPSGVFLSQTYRVKIVDGRKVYLDLNEKAGK